MRWNPFGVKLLEMVRAGQLPRLILHLNSMLLNVGPQSIVLKTAKWSKTARMASSATGLFAQARRDRSCLHPWRWVRALRVMIPLELTSGFYFLLHGLNERCASYWASGLHIQWFRDLRARPSCFGDRAQRMYLAGHMLCRCIWGHFEFT